jgi:hypothetical protein
MAHFAQITNGIVTNVIVVHNNELLVDGIETEVKGSEFCHNLLGGNWIQTSYNNNIRKQYAGIGFVYDEIKDEFVCPQPFASWTLDSNNDWQPPIPKPQDHLPYKWNESLFSWLPVLDAG